MNVVVDVNRHALVRTTASRPTPTGSHRTMTYFP